MGPVRRFDPRESPSARVLLGMQISGVVRTDSGVCGLSLTSEPGQRAFIETWRLGVQEMPDPCLKRLSGDGVGWQRLCRMRSIAVRSDAGWKTLCIGNPVTDASTTKRCLRNSR